MTDHEKAAKDAQEKLAQDKLVQEDKERKEADRVNQAKAAVDAADPSQAARLIKEAEARAKDRAPEPRPAVQPHRDILIAQIHRMRAHLSRLEGLFPGTPTVSYGDAAGILAVANAALDTPKEPKVESKEPKAKDPRNHDPKLDA